MSPVYVGNHCIQAYDETLMYGNHGRLELDEECFLTEKTRGLLSRRRYQNII